MHGIISNLLMTHTLQHTIIFCELNMLALPYLTILNMLALPNLIILNMLALPYLTILKTSKEQNITSELMRTIQVRMRTTTNTTTTNNQDEWLLSTAGTGKSHLIKALAQLLGSKCTLTACTAIAGCHIGGITLHSTVQLPVQAQNNNELGIQSHRSSMD